jgi:hypothetical protein
VFPRERKRINNPLIERTCRITLDVKVLVSVITRENVADSFIPTEAGEDGLTWEWAERQNRLLLILIKDEETLKEFLVEITRGELAVILNSDHTESGKSIEQELIERIALKMEGEDVRFFQEVKEAGILWENAQLVDEAFWLEWERAEVQEIRVLQQSFE